MDCVECPIYPCPFGIIQEHPCADGCGHTEEEILSEGKKETVREIEEIIKKEGN